VLFTNGVATATLQAFDAQTATLDVSGGGASSQSAGGTGLTLTVSATLASAYQLTGGTLLTAGGSETVTITRVDQYGNAQASGSGSPVDLLFSGLGTAPDGQAATVNGVPLGASAVPVTFNAAAQGAVTLQVFASETATLQVTDGTLSSQTPGGSGLTATVTAAAATQLQLLGFPTTTNSGLIQPLTVEAVDTYGNADTTYQSTIIISISDAAAVLALPAANPPLGLLSGTTYTFAPGARPSGDGGIATFAVTLNTPGAQSIQVTSGLPVLPSIINIQVAAFTPPTSQTAAVVLSTGTTAPITSGNITVTVSGGNANQTTLAVAATYANGNPTPDQVVANGQVFVGLAFNDFRIVNPAPNTTATLTFTVPFNAPNAKAILFVDGGWVIAAPQVREGDLIIVTLSDNSSSTPMASQLNGTIFTIAVAVGAATSNSTVGIFPPLASTETLPAVQASFVSSSSLSLTLSPLQQSTITTSQSTNTGGGDGDGASASDIQAMWDYFNDFWRSMLIGLEQLPSGKDIGVATAPATTGKGPGLDGGTGATGTKPSGATGTGVKTPGTGGEAPKPQSRRTDDARDAFFATTLSTAELPVMLPGFAASVPALTEDDRYGASALLGLPCLAVMLEEIHLHRARQRWPGVPPKPAVAH